ncbi:hypothetical protein ES319_A06G208200v1, partial [Gossypium barbadense]
NYSAIFKIFYISFSEKLERREKSISSGFIFPFYSCPPTFGSLVLREVPSVLGMPLYEQVSDMGRVGHPSICSSILVDYVIEVIQASKMV